MDFVQTSILVLGALAMYLTRQGNESRRKYACIFGLLSQPFFLYATYQDFQPGMFILAIWHTLVWVLGVWNYWVPVKIKLYFIGPRVQESDPQVNAQFANSENYLRELSILKAKIQVGFQNNLYSYIIQKQLLDLINDAEMVADVEFCNVALNALKYKMNRLGAIKAMPVDLSMLFGSKVDDIQQAFFAAQQQGS